MSMPNPVLIMGLGNPGEKYYITPHNAGFLVIDKLTEEFKNQNLEFIESERLLSQVFEVSLGGKKLILTKPLTFMNKSGDAARQLLSHYKIPKPSLIIIHDEIDLELGKIKIVKNRGSAGHKGVEDIIQKLETKDFVRFRIGILPKNIPAKRSKLLMDKFVVSKFDYESEETFQKTIRTAKEAVMFALENGIEKTANIYNTM